MEDSSDRQLWDRAASGSDAAFGILFERHSSAVYNYCFRRLGNWAAAEDVMAATFLESWRRRDEVKLTGESLRPWLLGVATNLLRNDRRSTRRRESALRRLATRAGVAGDSFADDVVGRMDDERRMTELLRSLSQLPTNQQDVVALVAWSGLAYDEAAIALGVAVGTVKSRLSRARKRLRELAQNSGHNNDENDALARASATQPSEVEG